MALALAGAACGDRAESPADEVAAVLREVQASFARGDVRAVCDRTVGVSRCEQTVRRLARRPLRNGARGRPRRREVIDVRVEGDRARVVVTLNPRIPGRLELVRRGGRWRLTSLAVRPATDRSRWDGVSAGYAAVSTTRVRNGRRRKCPPITAIRHAGERAVDGGCALRVVSDAAPLWMLTSFGDAMVARCRASYLLHVAPNTTSALADRIRFGGRPPCGEVRHCRDGETGLRYPWQGMGIAGERRPAVHMHFDICVNTPFGRARGFLHFRLAPDGSGGWAADPYDYPIGDRSIQIGGDWRVMARGVRFRATER
jgi:hypothetical protein